MPGEFTNEQIVSFFFYDKVLQTFHYFIYFLSIVLIERTFFSFFLFYMPSLLFLQSKSIGYYIHSHFKQIFSPTIYTLLVSISLKNFSTLFQNFYILFLFFLPPSFPTFFFIPSFYHFLWWTRDLSKFSITFNFMKRIRNSWKKKNHFLRHLFISFVPHQILISFLHLFPHWVRCKVVFFFSTFLQDKNHWYDRFGIFFFFFEKKKI